MTDFHISAHVQGQANSVGSADEVQASRGGRRGRVWNIWCRRWERRIPQPSHRSQAKPPGTHRLSLGPEKLRIGQRVCATASTATQNVSSRN